MSISYKKGFRGVYRLTAHIVFVTKYRKKAINQEILTRLEQIFSETLLKWRSELLEFNGESDHIHVLIEYPPKLSISGIVNALKGVSSRKYGQAGLPKPYGKQALWSPSYFVSSVGGAPLEILKKYIQNQEKPS